MSVTPVIAALVFGLAFGLALGYWLRRRRDACASCAVFYDDAPCGYGALDERGVVVESNLTALRWLGYERDEILGKRTFIDLLTPESRDRGRAALEGLEEGGEVSGVEIDLVKKDGNVFHALASLRRTRDGGGKSVVRATVVDITSRRRIEQDLVHAKEAAEHASHTKSVFLANMSHEIRTPLGAILGFTELLRLGRHSPEQERQFLETIERNGRDLARLIDDILDLSKVEAGKLDVETIPVAISPLLQTIEQSLSVKARERAVALTVQALGKIPETIHSDPTRIRQILLNVIGNALKFTSRGQVMVTVQHRQDAGHVAGPRWSRADSEGLALYAGLCPYGARHRPARGSRDATRRHRLLREGRRSRGSRRGAEGRGHPG